MLNNSFPPTSHSFIYLINSQRSQSKVSKRSVYLSRNGVTTQTRKEWSMSMVSRPPVPSKVISDAVRCRRRSKQLAIFESIKCHPRCFTAANPSFSHCARLEVWIISANLFLSRVDSSRGGMATHTTIAQVSKYFVECRRSANSFDC